jgi:A/G-specific adenine glycosylase
LTDPEAFAGLVLTWFDEHGRRNLPWQREPTAYRVWVSEIMLQQTQVGTVIPYFDRFVKRFPDLPALARASLDEVLQHWSGLGYYARARNLHRLARELDARYGGVFPRTLEEVQALPGIGRSTAGAILSLAFGLRHPILDGNVKRLLARVFAVPGWPGAAAVQKRLWELAERYTPRERVAHYNQAVMDLGASVCTRGTPGCAICPLSRECLAHAQGLQQLIPAPRPRRAQPVRNTHLLVLRTEGGELLLERRPPSGIWGGLWSFPECDDARDIGAWCGQRLGLEPDGDLEFRAARRHTFSHFHLNYTPVIIPVPCPTDEVREQGRYIWHRPGDTVPGGLAAPVAQLIEELNAER